ncbi:hypothetical protein SRABI128_05662 [Microbacterium sp. Bi128]|nr:hypothetical protein SRABI128_05662 [Microbacterium sp. Bi128]
MAPGGLLHLGNHVPGARIGVAGLPGLHPPFRVFAQTGGPGRRLVALVLAGQPPAAQRRPWQQPDPGVECGRNNFRLDLTDQQAVLRLKRHRGTPAMCLRHMDRLGQLPAQEVGEAVVGDFAAGDGVVQEPEGLLEGRNRVPRVQLVEIDLFYAEPAQRVIECPDKVPAGGSDVVGGLAHREAALRGHHRPVPDLGPVRQPPADDFLRHPRAVDVGGVDEVAARREVVIQDRAGLLLGGLGAKSHGAQRIVGDDGAAVAQGAVLHGAPQVGVSLPWGWCAAGGSSARCAPVRNPAAVWPCRSRAWSRARPGP